MRCMRRPTRGSPLSPSTPDPRRSPISARSRTSARTRSSRDARRARSSTRSARRRCCASSTRPRTPGCSTGAPVRPDVFDGEVIDFNADQALADLTAAEAKVRAALEADPDIDAVFSVSADVATGSRCRRSPPSGATSRSARSTYRPMRSRRSRRARSRSRSTGEQYAQGHLRRRAVPRRCTSGIELRGGLPMYTGPALVTADNVEAVQASVDAGTR